jgi:hypothetical protein
VLHSRTCPLLGCTIAAAHLGKDEVNVCGGQSLAEQLGVLGELDEVLALQLNTFLLAGQQGGAQTMMLNSSAAASSKLAGSDAFSRVIMCMFVLSAAVFSGLIV